MSRLGTAEEVLVSFALYNSQTPPDSLALLWAIFSRTIPYMFYIAGNVSSPLLTLYIWLVNILVIIIIQVRIYLL